MPIILFMCDMHFSLFLHSISHIEELLYGGNAHVVVPLYCNNINVKTSLPISWSNHLAPSTAGDRSPDTPDL